MDVRQYTYVEVDIGDQRIWAVGPQTQVAVGDTVFLPPGILMVDFFSNGLDRNFDRIYMVQSMRVESDGRTNSEHPAGSETGQSELERTFDFSGIERVEGGHTVGEIFERKASLAGQGVAVRGKVVKTKSGFLGWWSCTAPSQRRRTSDTGTNTTSSSRMRASRSSSAFRSAV
jgi:hypothetical protein